MEMDTGCLVRQTILHVDANGVAYVGLDLGAWPVVVYSDDLSLVAVRAGRHVRDVPCVLDDRGLDISQETCRHYGREHGQLHGELSTDYEHRYVLSNRKKAAPRNTPIRRSERMTRIPELSRQEDEKSRTVDFSRASRGARAA